MGGSFWKRLPPNGWGSTFPATAGTSFGSAARWRPARARPSSWRWPSPWHILELIGRLQEQGAVHQAFHEDEDADKPGIAICNCCWDCRGVFGSYSRGFLPLNLRSYFEARISDEAACSGCATCVDFCPVQAISLTDDHCRIDGRRCIGCGQCELQCPEDAVSLVPNERTVMLPMMKRSEARIP